MSDAITYSTGAVAADANGFFHPLGDHAQTTFVIDGQPVSDQQSKLFSTQIPLNALQGMELITGSPEAQYGDKTSLVVRNATTRSGLGAHTAIRQLRGQLGIVRNVYGQRHAGIWHAYLRKFPGAQCQPFRPLSGYSGIPAHP